MKYYKKLIGELVYLSPVNIEDAPKYTEWLCDEDITKYLGNYTKNINLSKKVSDELVIYVYSEKLNG